MFAKATRKVEIFRDLSPEQIKEFYTWLQRRDVPADTVVFEEGETPDGLYLLCEGTVSVLKGPARSKTQVTDISAPSCFGEMSLLSASARSATVKAKTNIKTGFLPLLTFRRKLSENNLTALRMGVTFGEILCARLEATTGGFVESTALLAHRTAQLARHARR
jgi:CRP-like cAMP-binding protein